MATVNILCEHLHGSTYFTCPLWRLRLKISRIRELLMSLVQALALKSERSINYIFRALPQLLRENGFMLKYLEPITR